MMLDHFVLGSLTTFRPELLRGAYLGEYLGSQWSSLPTTFMRRGATARQQTNSKFKDENASIEMINPVKFKCSLFYQLESSLL